MALLDMFSKPTQDVINSNFRKVKAVCFNGNFSPLEQALSNMIQREGQAATKESLATPGLGVRFVV